MRIIRRIPQYTMPHSKPLHDVPGRVAGILSFLGGIAMLVFVFLAALDLFHSPLMPASTGHAIAPTAIDLGTALARVLKQLLLLSLATVAASLVTSHGVKMYFAANGWIDTSGNRTHEDVTPPAQPSVKDDAVK